MKHGSCFDSVVGSSEDRGKSWKEREKEHESGKVKGADDDHSPATGDNLVKTHHRFFHCQIDGSIDGSKGEFHSGRRGDRDELKDLPS